MSALIEAVAAAKNADRIRAADPHRRAAVGRKRRPRLLSRVLQRDNRSHERPGQLGTVHRSRA